MTLLVEPGTVEDTTAHPGLIPVRVEAVLAAPLVGVPGNPLHLDGPLSWAAFLTCDRWALPPRGPVWAVDFVLPLATWTSAPSRGDADRRLFAADGRHVWGWACSAAAFTGTRPTVAAVRRLPDTAAMAWWGSDRRHHLGLGPRRAVNGVHQATAAARATWWALTPDPHHLQAMLGRVSHLGRVTRHGNGRVLTWHVTEDGEAAARWKDRAFPDLSPAAGPGTIRAPYHHPSRRMPITPGFCQQGRPLWR